MFDQQAIIDQVLQNCDISDSRYAGNYSICGLFLRLRDLYKWEKGLDPWIEKESTEILDWIDAKEQKWETLSEENLKDISIAGKNYDPFDVCGINDALEPHGLFYGGGYARGLKPSFVLSNLEEKRAKNGHDVYILGRELARDLFSAPALLQEDCIVIRRESAARHLWDQIFYVKQSSRDAMSFALAEYGLDLENLDRIHEHLEKMVRVESDRYLYHELGELQDAIFDRNIWREVIAAYPHTPVELLARAVKDLLADTDECGPLRLFSREQRTVSLAFYVAFLDGLVKELFPEILTAFREFKENRDWRIIDGAISAGQHTARYYAESISAIYLEGRRRKDTEWAKVEMGKRLLSPLGI